MYANVPKDDEDLMVPRPLLTFLSNMTFQIGRYYQEQPYIFLQFYTYIPSLTQLDDVIAHPGWHLSMLDLIEQRPAKVANSYREKIIIQEWKTYPVTVKLRRKYLQSKKQKPCTKGELFSQQKVMLSKLFLSDFKF